jgi:hypothetical protein
MQRFFLTGLFLVTSLFGSTIAQAGTRPNAQIDEAAGAYWATAHNLAKAQVTLLDRLERSTQQPEAKRLRALSGQVLLYTASVDRFLMSNYPEPDLLCSPPAGLGEYAGTDGASLEQVQVYCSLYRSTRELATVRTRLNYQAKLINTGASEKPTRQATQEPVAVNGSSRDVLVLIQASRQRLAQMQPSFPEALRISITQLIPAQSADMR